MGGDFSRIREAWFEWELLRAAYNAIMILQGVVWLVLLWKFAGEAGHGDCHGLHGSRLMLYIVWCFLLANFFYCAGPLLETFCWVVGGWSSRRLRRGMVTAYLLGSSWMITYLGAEAWRHVEGFMR